MRILHVVASVGHNSGGLGQVALGLTQGQYTLGHDPAIWCLDPPTEAIEVARMSSFECPIVTSPVIGPSTIGYSPTAERMASSSDGNHYDILHQHGIWMANSRVTNRWRAAFGRPTVVAPHGTLEPYALRRSEWKKRLATLFYEGANLQDASCVHVTSTVEAASCRKYGLTNPIAVIPDGVPEAWIHSTGDSGRFRCRFSISSARRLILFLSRVHPIKGLPLLFEAMARLKQQLNDWLLVVGGPDERGYINTLRILANKLHIENLIRFVGPLFGPDKRDAFAAADLFVLPTYSENFGIVVAEALGAGVPVLTTRGAPWEALETYRCGWWVDVNAAAIQDALVSAIQCSREELRLLGQHGKVLVAEKYTWSEAARKSLSLYKWLIGHGERPNFIITD